MPLCNPSFLATSNILPSIFVICDPAASKNFYAKAGASASVDGDNPILGISQEGTQDPPGVTGSGTYAATDGKPIDIYGPGDVCLLTIGSGGCTAGNWLKADATGLGVIIDTSAGGLQFYGAKALQTCSAGELCRVLVQVGAITT